MDCLEQARPDLGRRLELPHEGAEGGRGGAELVQPGATRWTLGRMLLNASHVLSVGRVQGYGGGEIQELVAGEHCLGPHQRSLQTTESSGMRRNCCSPRRMRVLIVPSGTPSSVATSNWVMPR